MRRRDITSSRVLLLVAAAGLLCLIGTETLAQQSGHNMPGDTGLGAGSQAPPGIYTSNVFYFYHTGTVKNDNGEKINRDGSVNVVLDSAVLTWVTNTKVLGATVGGSLVIPFIKNRLETNRIEAGRGVAFSDVYVQPLQFGWHFAKGDVTAGYAFYAPTGDFSSDGRGNSGLGMFSHEFSLGGTVPLNKTKTWNVSALGAYEIHTTKSGVDLKVGDMVTIEGGLAKTFIKMNGPAPTAVINVGLAGYTQFKATADSGTAILPALRGLKDRVFGVGPEVNATFLKARTTVGVRYVPEFGARNTTQGQVFAFTLTYQAKPLPPPVPATP
jgi:hypothetical protein